MDLSEPVLAGLAILGDPSALEDAAFEALVKHTTRNACGEDAKGVLQPRQELHDVKALADNDMIKTKSAHLALTTFLYEAAKTDVPQSQISSALEEAKIGDDRAKTIVTIFEKCKPLLRRVLSRNRMAFPQLVGAEWRLDHGMRSRNLDQMKEPVYLLRLRLKDPATGKEREIEMSCKHHELSDLYAQLKSATSRVERLVRGKK
eukprot:CAMPEP_0114523788 /NCGR_PEP_ID=MMETSP0109-20121206/21485_1 /TAXON_ID=29199 /ORGANISM="Chlorarachnion reptans, Strain CCCM449" /LENGTH=203 /DNA_ID=CAMNT_0001705141 /DNA_START=128 /DNA_END=739 /DNA_ORIENTATION=+